MIDFDTFSKLSPEEQAQLLAQHGLYHAALKTNPATRHMNRADRRRAIAEWKRGK